MEELLRKAIGKALAEAGAEGVSFAVEWPTDLSHGDYATNAALAAAKPLGRNPRELADELARALKEALKDSVESVETAGPGFINFTLARPVVAGMIQQAGALAGDWGRGADIEGKRYSIEYSCPNPFKEMHIGHLMNTVIGEAISRIVENGGATVIRDTYGGDVGPHVAKTLWALRKKGAGLPGSAKEVGDAYEHGARAYEESEEAKVEIDALNSELYTALATPHAARTSEQAELLELWRAGRDQALEAFREIYRLVGSTFDYFLFESETTPIGLEVVADGLARGVFEESEGAIVYKGEKKGLHTLVFITSRGTPTYEAKEVGLAFMREERIPNDQVCILTGMEQVGHFQVFLAALEDIAPLVAQKTTHVPHGLLQLTTGKMASRKGNVITAAGLLSELIAKAAERNEDPLIAEQVGVAALKYMVLRAAPGSNVIFDPEKSLSLDGDSGPYLQYALVRARKILSYAKDDAIGQEVPAEPYDIERLIIHFPEVCAEALREKAPHKIAQYLTKLAGEWNSFYASEQVLGSTEEAYKQRVARAFATTMENGLLLLAIPAPERM